MSVSWKGQDSLENTVELLEPEWSGPILCLVQEQSDKRGREWCGLPVGCGDLGTTVYFVINRQLGD